MLRRRVIVCLDVDGDRVVKGTRFVDLQDKGDPVELAARYQEQGADEVVFLDISASHEGRDTVHELVRRTAETLFIPLTVGGGIRAVEDVDRLLRAGADKVSVNSAAVRDPELLTRCAERFGAQCVVASIDSRTVDGVPLAHTHGGRQATDLETVAWARRCAELGAGEILLTSMDHDGVRTGFDVELLTAVVEAVPVPVIASGGAGAPEHFVTAFRDAGVDAALAAGIFHDGLVSVADVKASLQAAAVDVRPAIGVFGGAAGSPGGSS